MKLLSCDILAFGGIFDRRIEFGDGLLSICDKNGSGKSTLAAFIKVMLYGFDGKAKKALADNERKLYTPWGGGRFGGSLRFSEQGKNYRIERFFDPDELAVIDEESEKPTTVFGEDIGEALLSVDADSFLRSIYLSSRGKTVSATTHLTAKLNDLSGEIWDLNAYDKANTLLEERRKEISLFRGKGGLLYEAEEKLYALKENKKEYEKAALLAEEAEGEAARQAALAQKVGEEKAAAEQLRLTLHKREAARGQSELRERLLRELAADKATVDGIDRRFPMGLPTEEETRILRDALHEEEIFASTLSDCREEAQRERAAYKDAPPTEQDKEKLHSLLEKENELKIKLYKEQETQKRAPKPADGIMGKLLPVAIGLLLALVGLLLYKVSPLLAAFLLCLGITVGGGGLLFGKPKKPPKEEETPDSVAEALAAVQEEIRCLACGFFGEDMAVSEAPAAFSSALLRQALLKKNEEKAAERLSAAREKRRALFAPYASLSLPPAELLALFVEAGKKKGELTLQMAAKEKTLEKLPPAETIPEPKIPTSEEELSEICRRLDEREGALREAAARALATAEKERAVAENLPLLLSEIEETEEAIIALREQKEILDKAKKLLGEAKESLETRYLSGVRERFAHYASKLSPALADFTLNTDLSVGLLREGKSRESTYFSSGWQSMIEICLRLSLLDALYPEGRPPLILDDPFALLDEDNLRQALSLLRSLSDCQILYLTAHPARDIQ